MRRHRIKQIALYTAHGRFRRTRAIGLIEIAEAEQRFDARNPDFSRPRDSNAPAEDEDSFVIKFSGDDPPKLKSGDNIKAVAPTARAAFSGGASGPGK